MMQAMESFLSDLKATDIGKAILAKQAATTRSARLAIMDRVAALKSEHGDVLATHDKAIKPLLAAFETAREKSDQAGRALVEAQRRRTIDARSLESQIGEAEHELCANADPRITEAYWAMQKRFESARLFNRQIEIGRNSMAGTPVFRTESNRCAIERLSEAMSTARVAFEALKLDNPEDLDAAIATVLAPVDRAWEQINELAPDA